MVTLFTIETTTLMILWIIYKLNIQKIDHRHDEKKDAKILWKIKLYNARQLISKVR